MTESAAGRHQPRFLLSTLALGTLLAAFVCIAILAGVAIYQHAIAERRTAIERSLDADLSLTLGTIRNWLFERFGDTTLVSNLAGTDLAGGGSAAPGTRRRHLDGILDDIARVYRYMAIGIYEIDGSAAVAASADAPETLPSPVVAYAAAQAAPDRPSLGLFFGPNKAQPDGRAVYFFRRIPRAAVSNGGEALAVLMASGDRVDELLDRDAVARGSAAHLYMIRGYDGAIDFLSNPDVGLNGLPDATRRRSNGSSVEARILAGAMGMISGTDIAGRQVLAVGHRIEPYNTYLVASIKVDDAFAELNRQTAVVSAVAGAGLLLLTSVGLLWRRGQLYRFALREAVIKRRFDFALRHANDVILLADAEGNIREINDRAVEVYGYPRATLLAMSIYELRSPAERISIERLAMAIRKGEEQYYETVHRRRDGSEFPVEVSVRHFATEEGIFFNAIIRDISERRQINAERRIAASVFEHSIQGIAVLDDAYRVLMVNAAFCELTASQAPQLVGQDGRQLFGVLANGSTWDQVAEYLATIGFWEGETAGRQTDGAAFHAHLSLSVIPDEKGQPARIIAICNDKTAFRQAQQRIDYLTRFDPQTELPARNRLIEDLELELGLGDDARQTVVAVFHVDRLGQINQALGYKAGDALLVEFGRRISHGVADQGTVYRFSGVEFAVAFRIAPERTTAAIGRALQLLREPFELSGRNLHITTSVGTATAPSDGRDPIELLRNAVVAAQTARTEGRNLCLAFRPQMNKASTDELMLEEELRLAVDRREFELFLQPQVSLKDSRVIGAETLVRWRHPRHGLVMPGSFITIAEQSDIILRLGDWIVEEACRIWIEGRRRGLAMPPLAVNLSARQFQTPNLVSDLVQRLSAHAVPPEALQLEITESMVMRDPIAAIDTMNQLNEAGLKLAIDDFGTGYSSLSYLQQFPVAKLKIDRSFVRDCEHGGRNLAIVSAIVAMAHSIGVGVIAEGVETAEQGATLHALGCLEAQGFFFARPLPWEDFLAYLHRQKGTGTAGIPPACE